MTRIWHNGPPPQDGWWNASLLENGNCWRWWDGGWSDPAFPDTDPGAVALIASHRRKDYSGMQWTDYWPEHARVPRIKP